MGNVASLMFYISLFTLSGICLLLHRCENPIIKKTVSFIAIIIPTAISAFRVNVGTDYRNYEFLFDYIRVHTWNEVLLADIKWEIGFKVLIKFLTIIGNNSFIFGSLSFLTLVFMLRALKYYDNINIEISYIVYLFVYFGGALNIVRQSLAFAMVFYAYHYIFINKKYKFFGVVLMAACIHVSALIALPVYYLWNHEEKKIISVKTQGIVLGIFLIAILFWRMILQLLLLSGLPFVNKFTYLMNNNDGLNRDLFVKIVILLIFVVGSKQFEKMGEENKFFIFLFIINCMLSFTGYQITFLKRIALYYEIPFLVLIGEIPNFFSKGVSRIFIKGCIIIVAILYFTLSSYVFGFANIIPYKWR